MSSQQIRTLLLEYGKTLNQNINRYVVCVHAIFEDQIQTVFVNYGQVDFSKIEIKANNDAEAVVIFEDYLEKFGYNTPIFDDIKELIKQDEDNNEDDPDYRSVLKEIVYDRFKYEPVALKKKTFPNILTLKN